MPNGWSAPITTVSASKIVGGSTQFPTCCNQCVAQNLHFTLKEKTLYAAIQSATVVQRRTGQAT